MAVIAEENEFSFELFRSSILTVNIMEGKKSDKQAAGQFRLYEVPFFAELERKQAKNILLAGW